MTGISDYMMWRLNKYFWEFQLWFEKCRYQSHWEQLSSPAASQALQKSIIPDICVCNWHLTHWMHPGHCAPSIIPRICVCHLLHHGHSILPEICVCVCLTNITSTSWALWTSMFNVWTSNVYFTYVQLYRNNLILYILHTVYYYKSRVVFAWKVLFKNQFLQILGT